MTVRFRDSIIVAYAVDYDDWYICSSPGSFMSLFSVEEVRQSWNATSAQVKARLDELEKMMTATEELKNLERELDRWLSRTEADLRGALSPANDSIERKRQVQVSSNLGILITCYCSLLISSCSKFA